MPGGYTLAASCSGADAAGEGDDALGSPSSALCFIAPPSSAHASGRPGGAGAGDSREAGPGGGGRQRQLRLMLAPHGDGDGDAAASAGYAAGYAAQHDDDAQHSSSSDSISDDEDEDTAAGDGPPDARRQGPPAGQPRGLDAVGNDLRHLRRAG